MSLGQDGSRKILRRSAAFLRDFADFAGKRGIVAAFFVAAGAVLEGIGLFLIIPLLSIFMEPGPRTGWVSAATGSILDFFSLETRFQRVLFLFVVFILVMSVRTFVTSVRDIILAELQQGFIEAQRARVAERLAAARWDVIVGVRHARIAHMLSGDIQRISSAAHFLLQAGVAAVMIVCQAGLAFLLSPALAALAFGLLVIGSIALLPSLRHAQATGRFITEANLGLLNSAVQFLGGLKLAVSQNLQAGFLGEFKATLGTMTRKQVEYTRRQTLTRAAFTLGSTFVIGVTVLIGLGVMNIATSVIITLLLILLRMNGPVMIIQQGAQQFVLALPAYEKVQELSAELVPRADTDVASSAPVATIPVGPVVFRNVTFRHEESDTYETGGGLRGADLTIMPDTFVGISGPSGAGKTTFADLLVGLFPPQSGSIEVGGLALSGSTLAAWRNSLSYVSQDPFLFHDTIRHNLLWAFREASEADLWAALRLVEADALVRRLHEGLDTVVGDRGTLLSGGERQRIGLARAILRKPRLLVLDEATSAIDVAGERRVLEALLAIRPRMTMVMIAHRAESLSLCDHIILLEQGRVADAGPERRSPLSVGGTG